MTHEFDQAMSVLPDGPDNPPGQGRRSFRAALGEAWTMGHAVNGGVLMALAATAVRTTLAQSSDGPVHAEPLALSAHFLSASQPGAARLDTEVLRRGRTLSTGQCSIRQPTDPGHESADGSDVSTERMRALVTLGDLESSAVVHRTHAPPALAAPEACVRANDAPAEVVQATPLVGRLDLRLDPASAGWAVGRPSGRGQLDGWMRFADGREFDAVALLFALDAMPPVSLDLGIPGWAPTIEFSAHVRGRPCPGWLQLRASSRTLAGGLLEEDVQIWDASGALVAQSRQLAGVRLPAGWSAPPSATGSPAR